MELNLRLPSSKNDLKVPFLVTEQHLDPPLIGFNAIEEIIRDTNGKWRFPKLSLPASLTLTAERLRYL